MVRHRERYVLLQVKPSLLRFNLYYVGNVATDHDVIGKDGHGRVYVPRRPTTKIPTMTGTRPGLRHLTF